MGLLGTAKVLGLMCRDLIYKIITHNVEEFQENLKIKCISV